MFTVSPLKLYQQPDCMTLYPKSFTLITIQGRVVEERIMSGIKFHDEEHGDASASQALLSDIPLKEEEFDLPKAQRAFPYQFLVLLLSAHALGWMLALIVSSSPGRNSVLSGDEINGIIPRSKLYNSYFTIHFK